MKSWTYEKAGVPHLKGDARYNSQISKLIASTRVPGVMGSATGFASLFDFRKAGIRNPLLVSSTDGVGTKLEIAHFQKRHDTIGLDLVAMCVNDLITSGAKPLFFLDYFATGKFHPKGTQQVLKGITAGCRQAGCALVGGETAIMPGFYSTGAGNGVPQYDLAGFSVGVVDRSKVIDGSKIRKGDVLLGLASTGFHSNGYSLLRKIFSPAQLRGKIGKELLKPTRIYVKPVLQLLQRVPVAGLVNITGGGFPDNLPRVVPKGLSASISLNSWPRPRIFSLVQDSGNITTFEMARTFNMGIGMVAILKGRYVPKAQGLLKRHQIRSWVIGEIKQGKRRSKSAVELIN
ncbi:MAG: phosphoribosylformylglycinamidine cyclo-ligase [Candidatus Omnitrophota bacterium]|nr:phosphoribosylformylglycinamidine cyclo-ligase [Candidatus Omnitrophota bacterium]